MTKIYFDYVFRGMTKVKLNKQVVNIGSYQSWSAFKNLKLKTVEQEC